MTREHLVRGEITFEDRPSLPEDAVAYVRLLDTSLADAEAGVVAERRLTGFAAAANRGESVAFELPARVGDERASYTVWVHVDADGDGRKSHGDYLTTQSYPVLTLGHPDRVSVRVRKI